MTTDVTEGSRTIKLKASAAGLVGAAAMFVVFLAITAWAESAATAWVQFERLWPWIVGLTAGFGIQIALHVHIREQLRRRRAEATAGVAASGGVSTLAMLACCTHRLTDVLPFLGISAAAVFLVQYQTPFLVLGVFSNLMGILFMLRIMQKHRLGPTQGPLTILLSFDLKKAMLAVAVLGVVAVGGAVALAGSGTAGQQATAAARTLDLPAVENEANGLAVKAEPLDLTLGQPIRIAIAMNTHKGSLETDLVKAAAVFDDQGNAHPATAWDGPPPGGHHLSGTLTFPALGPETKSFRLILTDLYGVPERLFEWQMR